MIDIQDQARNKWASILSALGVPAKALNGRHHACPLCGGTDRFRFDDLEGRGTWFCNVCGAGSGMDLALRVTGQCFRDCAGQVRSLLGQAVESKPVPTIDRGWARQHCREIWQRGRPLTDTDGEAYLASRGLRAITSPALKFHPLLKITGHTSSALPAIVARVVDASGNGVGIHRVYLENGQKAARKLLSAEEKLPESVAIRLSDHNGVLGIAEGIETALAVRRDFGIPCWSVLNAGFMAKFIASENVRELRIFGDNDTKFGGQAAAFECAHRNAIRPGAPLVTVYIPPASGTDWADQPISDGRAA